MNAQGCWLTGPMGARSVRGMRRSTPERGHFGLPLGPSVQTDGLFKKASRGCVISLGTKQEVDRSAVAIDGPVQVLPLAADFDVRLVHPPTRAHRTFASSNRRSEHGVSA